MKIDGHRIVEQIRKAAEAGHILRPRIVSFGGSGTSKISSGPEIPDDGGNRIIPSESEPDADLYEEGDVWVELDSAGDIIAIYVHISGVWTLYEIADVKFKISEDDDIAGFFEQKIIEGFGIEFEELPHSIVTGDGRKVNWRRDALNKFRHKSIYAASESSSPYIAFSGMIDPGSPGLVFDGANPSDGSSDLGKAIRIVCSEDTSRREVGVASGTQDFQHRWNPKSEGLIRTDPTLITFTRLWWGFFGNTPALSDDNSTAPYIGFRYSTSASDSNWRAVMRDAAGGGGVVTNIDTGIAVAANTHYRFRIEIVDGVVKWFIDDDEVGSADADLPSNSAVLAFWNSLTGLHPGIPTPPPAKRGFDFFYMSLVID